MKYFTLELWHKLGSPDKTNREAALLEWENNAKVYFSYLRSIVPQIPHDTMNAINEITEGVLDLHDFRFAGVEFSSVESAKKIGSEHPPLFYNRTCHLHLTDNETNVDLIMSNLKKLDIDIEYGKESNTFDVRWGYCEFSYKKPNVILSVLWDSGHTWQFEFSSLSIMKSAVGNAMDGLCRP